MKVPIATVTNIKSDYLNKITFICNIKNKLNNKSINHNKILGFLLLFLIIINILLILKSKLSAINIKLYENKLNESNDSFLLNFYKDNNYLINGRITAFVTANSIYCNYIPLYCASLLYSDKRNRTDIEIAIDLMKLPQNIEKALEYMRTIYNSSKIFVRYNSFKIENNSAYLYGKKVLKNSIRFLIEPEIKNEYIFIGDIDIVYLVENYYDNYLIDMFNRTSCYSNKVRLNSKRLTGVHFSKWFCLYPILLEKNINLMMNDEELLLKRLKTLGVKIDYNTQYRPIFGIHMSVNRKYVEINNYTWEASGKRLFWKKFKNSETYKFIFPLLDKYIINKIRLLEKYYLYHE